MEKRETIEVNTMRIVTRRIVPFLMLLYFVAYLDRVNVGFAAITMNEDLGLSQAAFGFGAGIFFLGYFLFEVPSNLALHRVGARIWIARIMLTWGIISGAMAFAEGPISFYVLRFMLGVAEAGFFPGIILYLSYWFPGRYRAGIIAMFMAAVPISIALGSPLSSWLLTFDGIWGLHGWQWLFLIESLPAVLLAYAVLKYLTDKPEDAKWLSQEQREWLSNKMSLESVPSADSHGMGGVLKALVNPHVLVLALVYFGTSAGLYTLGIWAPQIISQFDLTITQVGVVSMIPPIFSVIAMVYWARHSDKTGERHIHVFITCLVAATGLLFAAYAESLITIIFALIIVNVGVSSAKPPLWAIPTQYLSGRNAAAGIAAINSIGNLGGFFGPTLIGYIKSTTGDYKWGLIGVSLSLAVSAGLMLVLSRLSTTETEENNSTVIN